MEKMDKSQIYQDLNFVPSEASKSEVITSPPDVQIRKRPCLRIDNNGPELDASNSKKALPSRSDGLNQIKDQLTAQFPSKLKVIPIVGMGGIGKTYLAKRIYMDTEISYHFHVCAWTTVSQEYKLRNVLLDLLRSFTSLPHEVPEFTDEQLTEMLYQNLKRRRYLIVLDDMWSSEIWTDFKRILPNDNNGSRIILTTRLMEVALCADLDSPPHSMKCLSNDESWKLLCNELFVGKSFPSDLVEIGKGIAKKCQGLPLAIVVVAGHLSNIDMYQDCWANFAKRLDSLITGNQEQILDILCLSYNYLPQHLKACFLYMGIFPKNSEIRVSKLIRLWSAVGFLHSEDEAEKCLEQLINRNLIMVRKKKFNGTARTCGIHDLLWDLCLREARKEGRCIFSQSNFRHSDSDATIDDMKYLMGLTSTFLYFGVSFETDFALTSICFRQLRVLDIQSQSFDGFPDEITDLIGLSYLELSTRGNIPGSVSKLCKLETLIIRHVLAVTVLPEEIWCLSRLRHLRAGICTFLPAASCASVFGRCVTILPDLQTLSAIRLVSCTKQLFSSIPNVKQLKVCGNSDGKFLFDRLNNLAHLHQLERLDIYLQNMGNIFWTPREEMRRQVQNLHPDTFPPSIKQLTLSGSHLSWKVMNILAILPNLEVLKLKDNALEGSLYKQTVEGFPKLKVLRFDDLDLEQWIADSIQFPVLQHLVVRDCKLLDGLPDCFGEIPTLESIEFVGEVSSSALESAKRIEQEQHGVGNYDLQVRLSGVQVLNWRQRWHEEEKDPLASCWPMPKVDRYRHVEKVPICILWPTLKVSTLWSQQKVPISIRWPMLKVVLKFESGYKIKNKDKQTVAELPGTQLIRVDVKDNTMTVIGDIDAVEIVEKLREVCPTKLVFARLA